MERLFTYRVDQTEEGSTVAEYLKKRGYSRQVLRKLKNEENSILRNGCRAWMRETLAEGDCLLVHLWEEGGSDQIEPRELPFEVVYEDQDLLVVSKPADMPVHPSMNHHEHTLANAVLWYQRQKGETYPYRCINRLDKDTTGLLIIAKHMLSAAVLYGQMRDRQIQRTYLALVKGRISEAGTIDCPIARKEASAIERVADPERGERAVTHYQPLDWGDGWTLVQCRLETGRTHQIRVHMSWIGHPLPGDLLYCPEDHSMDRQPLHSWKLCFRHPVTGEELRFCQPVPEDMLEYMRKRK